MVSLDDLARLAAELPTVAETERHGNRSWTVAGKVFAWERPFSKADIKRFGDATPPAGPIAAGRPGGPRGEEGPLAAPPPAPFTIPPLARDAPGARPPGES